MTNAIPVPVDVAPERTRLALDAAWEIDSIANVLIEAAQRIETEDLFVRGLSIRAKALAGVMMSALSDEAASVATMRNRLTGMAVPPIDGTAGGS